LVGHLDPYALPPSPDVHAHWAARCDAGMAHGVGHQLRHEQQHVVAHGSGQLAIPVNHRSAGRHTGVGRGVQ
jgi:hypothetical protein